MAKINEALDPSKIYKVTIDNIFDVTSRNGNPMKAVECTTDIGNAIKFFIFEDSTMNINVGDTIEIYGDIYRTDVKQMLVPKKYGGMKKVSVGVTILTNVKILEDAQADDLAAEEKRKYLIDGDFKNVEMTVIKRGENKYGYLYVIVRDAYGIEYYVPMSNLCDKTVDVDDTVYVSGVTHEYGDNKFMIKKAVVTKTLNGNVEENRPNSNN